MAFWNKAPEVNRQFRWYMIFGSDLNSMRYAIKKAAKPTIKISEVKHKYLNHEFYYPGRVEWEPITVSFASVTNVDGANTASGLLINIRNNSGYVFPTTNGNVSTGEDLTSISKLKAIGTLTEANGANGTRTVVAGKGGAAVQLVQIDADGKPVETWQLVNPFFTEVKFDSLEYASEEILNLDCTIKYDYAIVGNDAAGILINKS